jgi:hypothetical protein
MTGQWVLLALVVYLLLSAPWCPVFAKAGKRWWVALLPVINLLVIMRIAARPTWWVLLLFVPLLGIAVWTVVCLDVAERFGHGVPFTIGLVFLPFFFALWLGLGPDAYSRTLPAPVAVPAQDEPRQEAPQEGTPQPPEESLPPTVAGPPPDSPVALDEPSDGGQTIGAGE